MKFGNHIARYVVLAAAFSIVMASCASNAAKDPDAASGASMVPAPESAISEALSPVADAGRVLVVYFSQGSATRRVAEDLAALTGADVEAIVERRTRTGFFGFMGAGMDATFRAATPIDPPQRDAAAYDAVFVCSPVWSWNLCPPVRSWLRAFKGVLPKAAYVTVSGDTDPAKIVKAMAKEGGAEPFAFAGFSDKDFLPENRGRYIEKIESLVKSLR